MDMCKPKTRDEIVRKTLGEFAENWFSGRRWQKTRIDSFVREFIGNVGKDKSAQRELSEYYGRVKRNYQ